MVAIFYFFGCIAILSTVFVILQRNPVYALLYLILSLLSISCIFFSLGAAFAGAIEIIIYAGAIMVLFMFVIMMFNMNAIYDSDVQECSFLSFNFCIGVFILMISLLIILLYMVFKVQDCFIDIFESALSIQDIGIALFGPYMLVVEIASFLLLGALISVLHITHDSNMSINLTQLLKYK